MTENDEMIQHNDGELVQEKKKPKKKTKQMFLLFPVMGLVLQLN
jgi:hypothetical protein